MAAAEMPALAAASREAGRHITIETAGTIPPAGIACDLASLSPKLSNSTPPAARSARAGASVTRRSGCNRKCSANGSITTLSSLSLSSRAPATLRKSTNLLAKIDRPIPPSKVLLMPQGVDFGTIRGRDETLVDICLSRGYRFCNRLHIEVFGNKRGT